MILGFKSIKIGKSSFFNTKNIFNGNRYDGFEIGMMKDEVKSSIYPAFFSIGPLFFRFCNGHIFKFKIQISTIKIF